MQGIGLLRPLAIQGDQLVRLNAVLAVLGGRVDPMPGKVLLRPRDEGGSRLMQSEQSLEIDIGPVHDVDRSGFGYDQIQCLDIMQFPVGDMDEGG